MNGQQNRRGSARVPIEFDVAIAFEGGWETRSKTLDLSARGLFVAMKQEVPQGTSCDVSIQIGSLDQGVSLNARGRVVRQTAEGVGIELGEIGFEAFRHLRRILVYNSVNPESAERELSDQQILKKRPL